MGSLATSLVVLAAATAAATLGLGLATGLTGGDEGDTSEMTSRHHRACPTCIYKTPRDLQAETDAYRVEAIKTQILTKLGLRNRPNGTNTAALPRELVLQALARAEDGDHPLASLNPDRHHHNHHHQHHHHQQPHHHQRHHDHDYGQHDDDDYERDRTSLNGHGAGGDGLLDLDEDDFYGRTSEIISFAEGSTLNGNRFLDFRITPEPGQPIQELRVREATLWLRVDLRKRPPTKCQQYLWAFRVKDTQDYSNRLSLEEENFGNRLEIDRSDSGWQRLNLTEMVRRWASEGGSPSTDTPDRLRVLIDCSCGCRNVVLHQHPEDPQRPFLVLRTDPSGAASRRVRKRALDCTPESGARCCKQRFYVSFAEIGWDDWVVAPRGYFANYCRGDCGHTHTPDAHDTYHAYVVNEARHMRHLSGMQPCCAPLKFSPVSLIYIGPENNIIKRDLPKMVVDECGCP